MRSADTPDSANTNSAHSHNRVNVDTRSADSRANIDARSTDSHAYRITRPNGRCLFLLFHSLRIL